MTMPKDANTDSRPLSRDIFDYCRSRMGGRRGLLILAATGALAGIILNWSWLVAVGIAPVLIAVLPCLVMCGLGLCMNRMSGGSCEGRPSSGNLDSAAGPVARLDASPAAGSVPIVRHQAIRRTRKRPAKK